MGGWPKALVLASGKRASARCRLAIMAPNCWSGVVRSSHGFKRVITVATFELEVRVEISVPPRVKVPDTPGILLTIASTLAVAALARSADAASGRRTVT